MAANATRNLQRDTLRKLAVSASATDKQKRLAQLRVAYSIDSKLLTGYINQLVDVNRIYPRFLPTQASGRTSTIDPPITNWPRECINQQCPRYEHEWTDVCWSVRDILLADDDEVLVTWDHDNIEGKIHDIIVDDREAIEAHLQGYDLHTITCCNIFGYNLPSDLRNPHTSGVDAAWRSRYNWQGKDTRQRVLAKNFNHGSKYTKTWRFVYKIKGIENYGINYSDLGKLAKRYIDSKAGPWKQKLGIMETIRKERTARSLYGFRRVFFDSSEETGREGFSHMISGTVSDYNNITLQMLEDTYGDSQRMLHNAHDGDKLAFVASAVGGDMTQFKDDLRTIIERDITYQGRTLKMTAGVKIYV